MLAKPQSGTGCGYESIKSSEFLLKESDYITGFLARSNKPGETDVLKSSKEKAELYSSVINGKFKFLGETFTSKYSSYKVGDVWTLDIEGETYQFSKVVTKSKIVTEDCKVFYFTDGLVHNYVKSTTGTPMTLVNYKDIFAGPHYNFEKKKVEQAEISEDKFTKTIKITGTKDGAVRFRAFGSTETGKLYKNTVQLYMIVASTEGWYHIKRAYDEDSNTYKTSKITTDVDCSVRALGCVTSEHIGIDVPVEYLRAKQDGFEVKVIGTKSRVLKIKSYQVRQILEAIAPYVK